VRWSRYKVLRDLIQNFYDSIPRDAWAERFSHRIEQGRLTLAYEVRTEPDDWSQLAAEVRGEWQRLQSFVDREA